MSDPSGMQAVALVSVVALVSAVALGSRPWLHQ